MKKTKLLLSLAMMCLSIAVLCFGVLAATSVTYSISGTISYEVKDVFVKINTSVYAIAEQQDKATVITTVKAMESKSQAESLTINSKTYTRTQKMDEYDSTSADTGSATGINLTYGGTKGYYTYYIVINIKNLSASKDVYARVTDNTTEEVNSIKTTNLYQNAIKSTETKNIVIAYSIKDKTSSIDSANINYSLKVSYETTAYTNPITIENDTTNSYYYVTLGTYDSSSIRWKLVSLDGVNKYTYDSSDNFEARYLSDAIFLQQSVSGGTVAFDAASTDYKYGYNNYYESDIRTNINELSNWNLTESDVSSLISKRNITLIGKERAYYGSGKYAGVTNDYFWLLSEEEVEKYMGTGTGDHIWIPEGKASGVEYWLREATNDGVKYSVNYVMGVGYVMGKKAMEKCNVRAAFQLA